MLPLPGYDHLGRKIVFGRWGIYNPGEVNVDDLCKMGCIMLDILLEEDEQMSITGVVMVEDCSGLTLSHAIAFTPAHAKKSLVMWQVRPG